MKRFLQRTVLAAAVATASVQAAPDASACGGRGGRSYRPAASFGYASPSYRSTRSYGNQVSYATPSYGQRVYGQRVTPAVAPAAAPASHAAGSVRQAAVQPASATQNSAAAPRAAATQRTPSRRTATTAAAQTTTAKPAATSAADAESSALAALAALAGETASGESAAPQTPSDAAVAPAAEAPAANDAASSSSRHVGTWRATLPANVVIELQLGDGGSFTWNVQKDGKTTSFAGQYRVTDGRLTLVRSNDLQKMAGNWTPSDNGFTFRLDGANNGGLDFRRG